MGSTQHIGNELFLQLESLEDLFASDGHKGIGGLDIFYCMPDTNSANVWLEPKNMGYPINSPSNDYDITDRGRNGYLHLREV